MDRILGFEPSDGRSIRSETTISVIGYWLSVIGGLVTGNQ